MLLRTFSFQTCTESWESQNKARRFHPALVAKFKLRGRKYRVILPVGDSDDWELYHEREYVYCVIINRGLDYAGLTVYYLPGLQAGYSGEEEGGGMFIDRDYDLESTFGRKGLDRPDRVIAKILIDHWMEASV